ncbi:hypothetical protein BJX99DRAFT_240440 [Aspergillus californicus]
MMSLNTPNGNESQTGHKNNPAPFGYSFPEGAPYELAPIPPRGPAILDDDESNMLDNFFTTINSNSFPSDFWLPGPQNETNRAFGLPGFDWSAELPPTFEGSTTSLPQPSFPHRGADKPLSIIPEHSSSNPDIVALYQNGLNEPDISFGNQSFPAFSNLDYPQYKEHGKERQQSNLLPSKRPSTSSQTHMLVGFHTNKMLFDVHDPISPEQQLSTKVRPLHWGSDSSFMDQGYVAPPDQPDEEQRTKELLGNLECLEPQSSATNTRAPTPDRIANYHPVPWANSEAVNHISEMGKDYGDTMEDFSHPKKKQRVKREDDDLSDGDNLQQRLKRSKGRRMSSDASRKSKTSQSSKNSRENLTEEQKRSNHILSEQKRRNLIRTGFEDLCTLVPGLKGGGFSKSAMLTQAADWLDEMIDGNRALKTQLANMKAMNGYGISQ